MKTWKYALLILVVLAAVNNSCSTVTPEKGIPVPSNIPSATIPPVTATPVATKTPVSQVNSSCWTVKPLQAGNDIKGSFVFIHYAPFVEGVGRKMESFFAWDLSSFRSEKLNLDMSAIKKSMGEERLWSTIVGSTNGDKFVMVTDNDVIFISQDGAEFISLPEKESADTIHPPSFPEEGWFLINTFGSYEYGHTGIEDTYYILNANTKEISKHKLFLPNFDKWNQWQGIGIYFSPDMKYVLYRSTHITRGIYGEDQFTLYDIVNNKVEWVMPPKDSNLLLVGGDPHWIPNTNRPLAKVMIVP